MIRTEVKETPKGATGASELKGGEHNANDKRYQTDSTGLCQRNQ
jgi:hypothetical protein